MCYRLYIGQTAEIQGKPSGSETVQASKLSSGAGRNSTGFFLVAM